MMGGVSKETQFGQDTYIHERFYENLLQPKPKESSKECIKSERN